MAERIDIEAIFAEVRPVMSHAEALQVAALYREIVSVPVPVRVADAARIIINYVPADTRDAAFRALARATGLPWQAVARAGGIADAAYPGLLQ